MSTKGVVKAALISTRSIFWWPREGQDVLPEKSNTAAKMDAEKLAAYHWRYVEGVLLRHGVPGGEVEAIGEAYRAGFVRGWHAAVFCRDKDVAATKSWWFWWGWQKNFKITFTVMEHFREAFIHGWKHRMEVA